MKRALISACLALLIAGAMAIAGPTIDASEADLAQRTADAVADLVTERRDPPIQLSYPIAPSDRHGAAYLVITGEQP